MQKDIDIRVCEKFALTISEASAYFNIGETRLRYFLTNHRDEDFIICNGAKITIVRKLFEDYLIKGGEIL